METLKNWSQHHSETYKQPPDEDKAAAPAVSKPTHLQFRPLSPTTTHPDLLEVVSGYENFLIDLAAMPQSTRQKGIKAGGRSST